MSQELIEAVAKALHAADRSGSWEAALYKPQWRKWAKAALAAIEASGTHAVVPLRPTADMLSKCDDSVPMSKQTARHVWADMIDARPKVTT